MTIAIGINFGIYILLIADTRTVYFDSKEKIIDHIDESEKITKTKQGLMTGAGNLALLDAVKDRLAETEVKDTNEIIKIIKEEQIFINKRTEFAELDSYKNIIEATGWIFTYITLKNKEPILRLAIYHPSIGSEIGLYDENKPAAIFPAEASKQESEELGQALENIIKPFNEFKNFSASVQYHIQCIGSFIDFIKPKFPSISSLCQIGIHVIEGKWISPIIKPREETKLSITLDYEEKD